MINDIDMNILATFCLNALSENDATHVYIRKSGFSTDKKTQPTVGDSIGTLPGPNGARNSGQDEFTAES